MPHVYRSTKILWNSPGRMDIFANSVPTVPCVSKNNQNKGFKSHSKCDMEPYLSSESRKLRRGLSTWFSATSCGQFEIVEMGRVQKANAMPLWEMEQHLCSGRDHLCRTFSPTGKMPSVLPLFKVAHVHLPVFTKSCIWDAFFNKILFVFMCVFRRK